MKLSSPFKHLSKVARILNNCKKIVFKKKIFYKILLVCLSLFLISNFLFIDKKNINYVSADVDVYDSAVEDATIDVETAVDAFKEAEKTARETTKEKQSLGSKLFHSTLGQALNTIAYDTATWIGSGGEGQKPLFVTEGWGEYLENVADNAAGAFIETLGDQYGVNLCNPDFAIKLKIGLGLVRQQRPASPECTFTEMKNNWEEELDNPNFLNRFQDIFDPTSNDLGIALTLHTGLMEEVTKQAGIKKSELESKEGWLDVRNAAGLLESIPGFSKEESKDIAKPQKDNIAKWTGDILVDAANIFLNQLAVTALNNLMKKLAGTDSVSELYSGDYGGLLDYEAGPSRGGIAGAEERFRQLIEPSFNTRGDYNILTELSMCPNPTDAGPTNCVLSDRFRQAIEAKITLKQAIDDGYLNLNGIFGFTSDGLEPPYNEGYPYRSMVILRKFRILPVGWEIAAQRIMDNPGETDGTKNLGDMVACFNDTDDYEGYYESWCAGLVDPGWVLKAPQNYCKREGAGPEIISENVTGSGDNSRLAITRNDTYCADEQACIKEDKDGSCELFGYCTEERRTWDFGEGSCEPLYNTCQTFRSREGQTASYLENTLDYSICSLDNVGCEAYCQDYDNINDTFTCGVNTGNALFADIDIEECSSEAEGCHEFIRTKAGTGANLLINSSFEDIALTDIVDDALPDTFDSWGSVGLAVSGGYHNSVGLQLPAGGLSTTIPVGASGFSLAGQIMTLSLYAKDCQAGDLLGLDTSTTSLSDATNWQHYSVTHIYPPTTIGNTVNINIITNSCVIDAIKLEFGSAGSSYSGYRQAGLINQKLAPDYLGCSGANPGTDCDQFVRFCGPNEVGCELYASASDGLTVPAQATTEDYCPAVCVGYDEYLQTSTYFDSVAMAQFIPDNAQDCSAQAVGCDEFTNLDQVGEGAEAREYYSYLKQCVDPGDTWPASNCTSYYTWEGSADTGYQLRVFMLAAGAGGAPYLTNSSGIYDGLTCDDTTYDLETNPMCREFFTNTGARYYRFYPYVVTCSSDCHPYRRTEQNIMADIGTAVSACQVECGTNANCLSLCVSNQCSAGASDNDRTCTLASGEAMFCKNGGFWRSDHQACLYMAIPDEGVRCSASEAGCREYSGNMGSNMRVIFSDNFEGSTQGWTGVAATTVSLSSNALMVGGESLAINSGSSQISKIVGTAVRQNKTYVLQFLAQAASVPVNLTADISGLGFVGTASLGVGLWDVYEFNLPDLDIVVDDATTIQISGNGDFFIDDIRLVEIIDRYFVIKDSWHTPEVCYEDIVGNYRGTTFNLGCDIYSDRDSNIHYLHGFTRLCDESAVGCELMIDTSNYSDHVAAAWNDNNDGSCEGDGRDCIVVPADEYVFVVYDPDKICNSANQGCQLFGNGTEYGNYITYNQVYLKNDPDVYDNILCQEAAEGCESWNAPEYTAYFKDPGYMSCEWREPQATTSVGSSWFKLPIKRCDNDGSGVIEVSSGPIAGRTPLEPIVCQSDNDCTAGISCINDSNDYLCPVDTIKTIGYGGQGNRVSQPTMDMANHWAGLCPTAEAGCSEYIDPISSFGINVIFNADFTQDVDGLNGPDGWDAGVQDVDVEPYTLYRLAGRNNSGTLNLTCTQGIMILNDTNILIGSGNSVLLNLSATEAISRLVYTGLNSSCTINVSNTASGEIDLKEAIIDYQIRQDVDRESCNGIVDFETGCVMFDERAHSGAFLAGLVWDADLTIDDGDGVSPQVGAIQENDANIILKVSPNRVCDKWLACRSYIKDEDDNNVCFDIGLCDSVDENGSCDSFVISNQLNQSFNTNISAQEANSVSGYAKAGYAGNSLGADMYPLGAMEQMGQRAVISNGNFELAGSNGYPIGWISADGAWNETVFKVVDNPVETQDECLNTNCAPYVPEGDNYIKLGSSYSAYSEFVDVVSGIDYVLTTYINTLNLNQGQAKIDIEEYNLSGTPQGTINDVIVHNSGNPWMFKLGEFTTGAATARIRVRLYSSSGNPTGNFYYDDIKVKPALQNINNGYAPQTCRLYPDSDSKSCEYFDSSGIYRKGWAGYCLEYDRYPGSSDACLLWWPVDKVKGEGIEEGAGYSGRFPMYYSIDEEISENDYALETPIRDTVGRIMVNCTYPRIEFIPEIRALHNSMVEQIIVQVYTASEHSGHLAGTYALTCTWNGSGYTCSGSIYGWPYLTWITVDADGYLYQIASNHCDTSSNVNYLYWDWVEIQRLRKFYASRIVQTVTPIGQNKFWSGRVYSGSDYTVPDANHGGASAFAQNYFLTDVSPYGYLADYPPFGSVVHPAPSSNPYEWDTLPDEVGNYPLYLEDDNNQYRAGQHHTPATVQRLYAQSYGTWQWAGSNTCAGGANTSQACVQDDCPGGTCMSGGVPICLNSINNTQECDPTNYNCVNCQGSTVVTGYQCGGTGSTCCESGVATTITATCAGSQPCGQATDSRYHCNSDIANPLCCPIGPPCDVCTGGANDGDIVQVISCAPLTCDAVTSVGGDYRCGGTGDLCCIGSSPSCAIGSICNAVSDNAGLVCAVDDCPGGSCVTGEGHYIRSDSACMGGANDGAICNTNSNCDSNSCVGQNWSPPSSQCSGNSRPAYDPNTQLCNNGDCFACSPLTATCDYCAVAPAITNIQVDNSDGSSPALYSKVYSNGFVNLTFNSNIDDQQMPLTMYAIDWGDDEDTVVSGVEMRDRPNPDNPHSMYHLYSYWDLVAKNASGVPNITCQLDCSVYGVAEACCTVRPSVKVQDNWGWCNNGNTGSPCPAAGYVQYNGLVVVAER